MGETVGIDKARLPEMSGGVAQPGNAAAVCRNRPDINCRHLLIARGKEAHVGVRQGNLVENESVVAAAVEIKKRHAAEHSLLPIKR
ncbi:MAG: hypothetical protein ACRD9W_10000 [Terriglobia bacterium]